MTPRVAIVTGAGQGIGRAIAIRLAEDGLDVVLNDLPTNAKSLEEAVTVIHSKGHKAIGVPGNAADEGDIDKLVQTAVDQFGGLDVFVANAGISIFSPLLDAPVEHWDTLMKVNARGTFIGYKAAAKQMIKQGRGGRIIGACSMTGKKATPGLGIYSASKFFIRGLTQAAAQEWGPHGITVNAYAPGLIDTPMMHNLTAEFKEKKIDPDGLWVEVARQASSVKSIGTVEDIAGLVSYLASESSRYVSGEAITIDGGTTLI